MNTSNSHNPSAYDPRWFIWTIVFLIIIGFSLVSYITVTGYSEANNIADFSYVKHVPKHK